MLLKEKIHHIKKHRIKPIKIDGCIVKIDKYYFLSKYDLKYELYLTKSNSDHNYPSIMSIVYCTVSKKLYIDKKESINIDYYYQLINVVNDFIEIKGWKLI